MNTIFIKLNTGPRPVRHTDVLTLTIDATTVTIVTISDTIVYQRDDVTSMQFQ